MFEPEILTPEISVDDIVPPESKSPEIVTLLNEPLVAFISP